MIPTPGACEGETPVLLLCHPPAVCLPHEYVPAEPAIEPARSSGLTLVRDREHDAITAAQAEPLHVATVYIGVQMGGMPG